MEGQARVGGHVTLIFSVHDDADALLEQGSRGAGLSLDRGVMVAVSGMKGTGIVSFDGDDSTPLYGVVFEELAALLPSTLEFDWQVKPRSELPISQGFGLSAAAAIACALAVQRALGEEEKIARARAIHIAHRVERRLSGGLGDVAALHVGGVELRIEPGCPPLDADLGGPGAVLSWHAEIPLVLAWRMSARQHTSNYIDDGDWKLAIKAAGEQALFGLREGRWEPARWGEMLAKSAEFAERSGLLEDAGRIDLLHLVGGALIAAGLASSPLAARLCMLGESVVVLPTDLSYAGDWQQALVEDLRSRGLGASVAHVCGDALNLRSHDPS